MSDTTTNNYESLDLKDINLDIGVFSAAGYVCFSEICKQFYYKGVHDGQLSKISYKGSSLKEGILMDDNTTTLERLNEISQQIHSECEKMDEKAEKRNADLENKLSGRITDLYEKLDKKITDSNKDISEIKVDLATVKEEVKKTDKISDTIKDIDKRLINVEATNSIENRKKERTYNTVITVLSIVVVFLIDKFVH